MSDDNLAQDTTINVTQAQTSSQVGQLGQGCCKQDNACMQEYINAEKFDEFGKTTLQNVSLVKRSKALLSDQPTVNVDPVGIEVADDVPALLFDSDGEDYDNDSEDENDSDEEEGEMLEVSYRISNKELADALLSKLVSKKLKQKCAQSATNPQTHNFPCPAPKKSRNMAIVNDMNAGGIDLNTGILPLLQTHGKTNLIYLFYEEVTHERNDEKETDNSKD
ncbi:hypothetical protein BDQ17DRAFT_1462196 [Cyathus striatus]|nr:hypothetical protein BDQ17DRAFT_1462196 [Cyathus striatus]